MRFEKCKDPTVRRPSAVRKRSTTYQIEIKNPSNTFYPPGLICAKEVYNFLCPTPGESGSPLMTLENQEGMETNGERFKTEGILSFINPVPFQFVPM